MPIMDGSVLCEESGCLPRPVRYATWESRPTGRAPCGGLYRYKRIHHPTGKISYRYISTESLEDAVLLMLFWSNCDWTYAIA